MKSGVRRETAAGRMSGIIAALGCGALLLSTVGSLSAQADADKGPRWNRKGELLFPRGYREWVFLTSGLGMTYGPNQPAPEKPPLFDNVFVNPDAYREFQHTGTWPDKTILILEVRRSEEKVSINNGGRTQGPIAAVEAAVKDRKRFSDDGWAYYSFDAPMGQKETATPFPRTARCYSCHHTNGAVDNTFVQFYPTLFEAAKRLGTVSPSYDPNRKP